MRRGRHPAEPEARHRVAEHIARLRAQSYEELLQRLDRPEHGSFVGD